MEHTTVEAPPGTRYDPRRQWLLPQGVVARDLLTHPLFPRPKKNATAPSFAVSFDELGGNTALGMHMSQLRPGAHNRGHRHLDEALIYIVTGHGWSELKQGEDRDVQRIEWRAGDIIAIPANAWHQHFNADTDAPSRQLAFKNTQLLRRLFGSKQFVYDNPFRLHERYDDETDFWSSRRAAEDGALQVNVLRDLLGEPLTDDPAIGRFTSSQRFEMGGHRTLDVTLLEIARRGHISAHDPQHEEALYVLSGRGRTTVQASDGSEVTVRWRPRDLVVPPLGLRRTHISEAQDPTRLLRVRMTVLQQAMRAPGRVLDPRPNDRFPALVEPDYPERPAWDPLDAGAADPR